MKPFRDAGFTLIELLVTLSVLVVLMLASIPLFRTTLLNHRLNAAAQKLYVDLQYARSEAVKRNLPIYVTFQTGDSWCYGINPSTACDCTLPSSCTLGTETPGASQQTNLSTTGFSGNTLIFDSSNGSASASGDVTFTLYGSASLIKLNVYRMGNVQMCSTGISGYPAC